MREIKAVDTYQRRKDEPSIFLAGSITGAADWQALVAEALKEYNVCLLNPRRVDWDASWKATIDEPQFVEQVEWELNHLFLADMIIMYFVPGTLSPITLLELGLHSDNPSLKVCCPTGFWRKGNVDIVCSAYVIPNFNTLEEMIEDVKKKLTKL